MRHSALNELNIIMSHIEAMKIIDADNILKLIILYQTYRILIQILLKFVPKGPNNDMPALVQIMAWWKTGAKPLSEPMMV